jgi:hypothetical protein
MSALNVLHLYKRTHGHVWTWIVALFQKSRVGCKRFGRHQRFIGKVSLRLQLEINTPQFLIVLTHNSLNNWGEVNVGAVPWKVGHILVFVWTSFLILLRRTLSWNVYKHFGYTLYPGIALFTSKLRFQTPAGKPICPLTLFLSCWYQTCKKWKIMKTMLRE